VPTTTGGLTFFGAPLNNYMTHAAAAMLRALRQGEDRPALLYGQGEFVTKHHAVVLARRPAPGSLAEGYGVQAEADGRRGPVPDFAEAAAGPARIESFTVLHDREGAPEQGVVILRHEDGRRGLARVPAGDGEAIALLLRRERTPIGTLGRAIPAADGVAEWRLA
jgi:hypothetical protein